VKTIIRLVAVVSAVVLLSQQSTSAQFESSETLSDDSLQWVAASASLSDKSVEAWGNSCQPSCCKPCCKPPHLALFGEFLYLRARDAEVAYGVPIDGPIVGPPTNFPIQIGRVGVVDHDHDAGFRVGARYYLDACSSVSGTFTRFRSDVNDSIETEAPFVIRSLVSHPGTQTAFQDFLSASANSTLDMDLVDLDYRHTWYASRRLNMTYLTGMRYVSLDQAFRSEYVTLGSEHVQTNVDFEGLGVRFGLEGEYFLRDRFMLYTKGTGHLIAGQVRADYFQGQTYDPSVVDTNWKAGRIAPIFELESGAGWVSHSGRCRITAGYMYSSWNNLVRTDNWIKSVQTNNFADPGGDSLTFDGLVTRVELRF